MNFFQKLAWFDTKLNFPATPGATQSAKVFKKKPGILYRSDCSVRTKSALFVHCCLCSIYLMKIGFEKIMGYPCSSLATKWKLQYIRPTINTKRFRKFCVRLTYLGKKFAPISHQILHLEKKFPKVYLIRTPSVSLPTAANPALNMSKWQWPASRQCTNRATLYERSNHCCNKCLT